MKNINPVFKLIAFLLTGITTILLKTLTAQVLVLIPLITMIFISDVKIRSFFSSLKISIILFLLLSVIYMYTINSGIYHFNIGNMPIYVETLNTAGRYSLRIWIILLSGTLFTKTTKDTEIAHAFSTLIYPLKFIGVPVERIGLTLSITMKYVPEFIYDAKQIMFARKIRVSSLGKVALFTRLNMFIVLFTPMFVLVFRKATSTYNALHVAGYDLKGKKTKFRKFKVSSRDIIFAISVISILAIAISLNFVIWYPAFADYWYWMTL